MEKKSRFIGWIAPADTDERAVSLIAKRRGEHPGAAHNCYAYRVRENNIARFSDDGEPSGTAGKPILEVIQGEGLQNILVVVTRYFGGTLLGTGGLVHAYKKSAKLAVGAAQKQRVAYCVRARVVCPYSLYNTVSSIIIRSEGIMQNSDFGENVLLQFAVVDSQYEGLCEKLVDATNGIAKITYIEEAFVFLPLPFAD